MPDMFRFHFERLLVGSFLFVTPDGPDDDLSECLEEAITSYAGGWQTRMQLLRSMLDHECSAGEDWREALLAPVNEIRRRARVWGGAHAGLTFKLDPNPAWRTCSFDRDDGPVDHYAMAFTTARNFFAKLIAAGIRPDKQNPFERDGWHDAGDDGQWIYCLRRYGKKADAVFAHAGAYFLPAARRPYHRSLFNPAGVTQRMAEPADAPRRPLRPHRRPRRTYMTDIETVGASPASEDSRVLHPLRLAEGPTGEGDGGRYVGIAVDVETTGLDHRTGKIIELAMRRFRYDRAGIVTHIDEPYQWREDPGEPLSPEIAALTGLTDIDLVGEEIDEGDATRLLRSHPFTSPA